jgi:hypothetical protein
VFLWRAEEKTKDVKSPKNGTPTKAADVKTATSSPAIGKLTKQPSGSSLVPRKPTKEEYFAKVSANHASCLVFRLFTFAFFVADGGSVPSDERRAAKQSVRIGGRVLGGGRVRAQFGGARRQRSGAHHLHHERAFCGPLLQAAWYGGEAGW